MHKWHALVCLSVLFIVSVLTVRFESDTKSGNVEKNFDIIISRAKCALNSQNVQFDLYFLYGYIELCAESKIAKQQTT